ncbi:unnamed protein product [Acanthoscelides obtectus]|uniref:Uncharacterized protein n=1 Tax=Acanthoscelides obtectus TaxID=200917 RepID=A0A9P0Q845_ACAOB|nr:unnamed protein product [Acanthoscelides obtectus]CAK1670443.1 hypothetical protein AOBTE_LOCUS27644 [Acanthoscelides obtectus]
MEIDGCNVNAKYVGQVNKIKWYSEHVRESQYLLKIVK